MAEDKKPDAAAAPADEKKKTDEKEPKGKGKKVKEEDELSEEDQQIKSEMELLVTRVQDPELALRAAALQTMVKEIRTATSSMTSVPKPLKFLRPHYGTLKDAYKAAVTDETKVQLADVLSMLAVTTAEGGTRESLEFKLQGTPADLASWGHEYVRHLAGEIGEEYNERLADAKKPESAIKGKAEDLLPMILEHMVPFFIEHNAESEAIDLLCEVGMLGKLIEHVDKTNCERIVMYLSQVANYVAEPEDAEARAASPVPSHPRARCHPGTLPVHSPSPPPNPLSSRSQVISVAISSLRKISRYPEAMRLAVKLQDMELISDILASCEDE